MRKLQPAAAATLLVAGILGIAASPAWASPPANDAFANASAYTGSFTASGSTVEATLESGEPNNSPCTTVNNPSDTVDNTVWYSLTPTISADFVMDTAGSNFDTIIDIYTGSMISSLTNIACNDDGLGAGGASTVTFAATAATTYWIRVGGYHNVFTNHPVSGSYVLHGTTQLADIAVSAVDSADPVSVGGPPYTYTVSVSNNGFTGATGVSVSTTLSGAARNIDSATTSQGSCSISAPTVSCTVGSIAASGSATITISVTPSAAGTITATATATLNETDPDTADNTDAESTTINNGHGCTITGTTGNDTLNGTNGADVICGLGGDDTINGDNGNDTIYAGAGNDTVNGDNGDNGNDHIYGGPGNDNLNGQNGDDVLVDTEGTDTVNGDNGNDSINVQDGTGGDTANGGLGTDACTVDAGDTTSSC